MLRSFQTQQNQLLAKTTVNRPLKSTVSSSSLYGTDVVVEEHRQLVDNIAKHVIHGELKLPDHTHTILVHAESI